MAGGLLQMIARARGAKVSVRTAGLAHHYGKPVAANAVIVMAEVGIDISKEYSKPITQKDVDWAEVIVPVQRDHGYHLIEDFPDSAAKIHFLDMDVADPYCRPLAEYRKQRDLLDSTLSTFIDSVGRSNP